jgi:tetratricopeptide (TPR) repeat protein
MANLHRLLSEQEFANADEAEKFIAETLMGSGGIIPRRGARTPVEEAQDVMYDAWEADGPQRARLARKALGISPDCADAYVLLAEETARSLEEARDLYTQGVAAGERALGKRMFKEEVGHFWGILQTRPYMRARAGLAQCLWDAGEREAAVAHYYDMLRLNPNDNQGIRDLLINCLLSLDRDEDACRLLRDYAEDGMATWMYSWALWAFRQQGNSSDARRCLKRALKQNPHVPAYLLGRKRLPRRLPDFIGFGDEDEAVAYTAGARENWRNTPGALDWLAAAL